MEQFYVLLGTVPRHSTPVMRPNDDMLQLLFQCSSPSDQLAAASPHAWQTQQHHSWRPLKLDFHAKLTQQMEMPTTSQSWELRSMDLHHFAISLCDTPIDAPKTPRSKITHSFFSKTNCSTPFSTRMSSLFCVVSSSSSSSVPSSFK